MPTDLTLPSIHLNGTSRKMLAEGYHNAYVAVQGAIRSFAEIEMNGRDYYPQGNDAYPKARTERDVQLAYLRSVRDYLEAHLIHLGE
jgi:hypothetical protein